MKDIGILLADDHGVVRKGLRFLIERQPGMEVVVRHATAGKLCSWQSNSIPKSSSWI